MSSSKPNHRGQSLEHQESRLRIFFGFFLLSCVLGLGIKLYFAPERLTPFLQEKVNESLPQLHIHFKSAELILANGVFPALALEIKDIEIQNAKTCDPGLAPIRIQKAKLPISLFKLFEFELALSMVEVQKIDIDIEHFQENCPAAETRKVENPEKPGESASVKSTASGAVPKEVPAATSKHSVTHQSFWDDQKLAKVNQMVSGVEFDEIKLYFDHHQKFLIFKNFTLRQNSKSSDPKVSYRLKSEFVLPSEYAQGELLPTAFVLADLNSDKMKFDISTQISEGKVQINSEVTPAEGSPQIDLNLEAKQLPVSSIANYLVKLGFLPSGVQPKFVWLSFAAKMQGRLNQLKQLPVEVNDVLLDGEFGQAKVNRITRSADGRFSDFVVDLPKVDVQKALDLFSMKGPDGVFSRFGEMNGELNFRSAKSFEFKGEWQDSALKFSRRGSRSEQQIENLKLDLAFNENLWTGKISDVELENGDFEGDINLKFDTSFDKGDVNLAINNLEFDPSVQKLMFLGAISGVKINGKLQIQKFLVNSWDGEIEVKSLDTDELSFKRGKFASHFAGNKLTLTTKFAEGEYKYGNQTRKALKKILLDYDDKNENIVFTNLRAELTQSEGNWEWKSLKTSILDDRVKIVSQGRVTKNEILSGDVSLSFPKAKNLDWSFEGPLRELKLEPNSPQLKSLLEKQSDFRTIGLE